MLTARFGSSPLPGRDSFLVSVFLWWWRTLGAIFPCAWINNLQQQKPRLLFSLIDDKLLCIHHRNGASQDKLIELSFTEDSVNSYDWQLLLSSPELTNIPRFLVLQADKVLIQTIDLPLEAENNLHEFFAYDMDRLTPVTANEVYYDFYIKHRDKVKGKITVVLFVISRDILDGILGKLKDTHLSFHGVDIVTGNNQDNLSTQSINLLPLTSRERILHPRLWTNITLTLLALCFLVSAQLFSLHLKQERLTAGEEKTSQLQRSTADIIELKKKVEEAEQASYFVMEQRLSNQSITQVLYRLTQVLPDNTYLRQLQAKNNQIELDGLSTSAASLVPLLEKSPWFYNTTLKASITKDRNTDKERYKIKVNVDLNALNEPDAPQNQENALPEKNLELVDEFEAG